MSKTYVEPVHAGEFLLSEGAGKISREVIELAPGDALVGERAAVADRRRNRQA